MTVSSYVCKHQKCMNSKTKHNLSQIRTSKMLVYKIIFAYIPGGPQKTSRTLRSYNSAYSLWGKIYFGTFVDQYVLLLTYKFQ